MPGETDPKEFALLEQRVAASAELAVHVAKFYGTCFSELKDEPTLSVEQRIVIVSEITRTWLQSLIMSSFYNKNKE